MRLVKGAILAAALASASAAAQPGLPPAASRDGPIASLALGPGEILVELSALGVGQARADTAKLSVSIRAEADTEAAVQAEYAAILGRVRAAARAAGVADADIVEQADGGNLMMFDVAEPPPPPQEEPATPTEPADSNQGTNALPPLVRVQLEPSRPRPSKFGTVEITLRQTDRVEALQTAVRTAGGGTYGRPNYSISDDAVARRAARADALAKARADADAYAAALNLRVVRIARISERVGFDFMSMMMGEMIGGPDSLRQRFEPAEGQVPVPIFVGVDFILAPR